MARKYAEVWKRIKEKGECTLSVHPLNFKTVSKGVSKEKDKDQAFKIANDFEDIKLVITRDVANHKMTFKLKQRFGLHPIVVV